MNEEMKQISRAIYEACGKNGSGVVDAHDARRLYEAYKDAYAELGYLRKAAARLRRTLMQHGIILIDGELGVGVGRHFSDNGDSGADHGEEETDVNADGS